MLPTFNKTLTRNRCSKRYLLSRMIIVAEKGIMGNGGFDTRTDFDKSPTRNLCSKRTLPSRMIIVAVGFFEVCTISLTT